MKLFNNKKAVVLFTGLISEALIGNVNLKFIQNNRADKSGIEEI